MPSESRPARAAVAPLRFMKNVSGLWVRRRIGGLVDDEELQTDSDFLTQNLDTDTQDLDYTVYVSYSDIKCL